MGGRGWGGNNGGRSWGRGSRNGRGGRGRGGRNSNNRGFNNSQSNGPQPKLKICQYFTKPGSICKNNNCTFSHAMKCHASIKAIQKNKDQSFNNRGYSSGNQSTPVYSCTVWESPNGIKLFTGGSDGAWRLWDTGNNFVEEFSQEMGNKITKLEVFAGFLFCGFEAVSTVLPDVPVGMIHVWNLSNPGDAPLEFQIDPQFAPYAHGSEVSALLVTSMEEGSNDPSKMVIISGDKSGVVRLWSPPASSEKIFKVQQTFHGHVGEVSALVLCNNFVWSSGVDGSMRVWDPSTGQCKHLVTGASPNVKPHTDAITDMQLWKNQGQNYVISSSLDGTVKAWSSDGNILLSEENGEGVLCMTIATDPQGTPVILCGAGSGGINVRSLSHTPSMPAFTLIAKLTPTLNYGHERGPVRCLRVGPSNTWYSGGDDGNLLVWQTVEPLVKD